MKWYSIHIPFVPDVVTTIKPLGLIIELDEKARSHLTNSPWSLSIRFRSFVSCLRESDVKIDPNSKSFSFYFLIIYPLHLSSNSDWGFEFLIFEQFRSNEIWSKTNLCYTPGHERQIMDTKYIKEQAAYWDKQWCRQGADRILHGAQEGLQARSD